MHAPRVMGLVLFICCAAALPRAAAEENSLGVPDSEAIARATALIKKTFAEEYAAARTPIQRAALASRFLKEAVQTRDNPPARYVLLCEARDLASKSGDAKVACRAVEHLSKHYGVAAGEMALAALSEVGRSALTPAAHESLARCAMAAADQAIVRDEYDLAGTLAALAQSAAERVKKITLLGEAQDKVREVAWAQSEHDRARAALETLTTRPDDRDAKSAAGRFKCLVKGDWERGLAMLLDGSDAAYRALAAADLAAATADATTQAKTADQWWEHGEKLPARARSCCRARAAYWYNKCLAKLSGFSKSTAEKRLLEIDRDRMRELRLEPGLLAEIFAGESFAKPIAKRIDPQLDFEWDGAPGEGEGLPKDNFSIRWTGQLRVTAGGSHTLLLIVNQGARIFIDDQLVIEEPDGTRKRGGKRQTITLTEGLHPIRVEFWDGGGLARIRLLWIPPAGAEQIIPASAFYHEVGGE
jgi:PA14 domain